MYLIKKGLRHSMKLYQKYLIILLIVLVSIIIYFYMQNKEDLVDKVHTVLQNILNDEIKNEKSRAFNFAYSLSQNSMLKKAIIDNKTKQVYQILEHFMHTLETFGGSKIHAQIVSTDFTIMARSWDNSDAGVNVKFNRPDLQLMKKSLKPHADFEAARRLVLLASIPILDKNKCIGFVDVIQNFDVLEAYFAQYDIDVVVLADDRYKERMVLLDKKPHIDNMIVANDGANINHIENIRQLNLTKLKNIGKEENKKYFYFSQVILNLERENIGYFVLVLSKKKLQMLNQFEKELKSFFAYSRKDVYPTTDNKKTTMFTYGDFTSKELLALRESSNSKDRRYIKKQLEKKLLNYTKEELISLLIDVNSKKISRGKIK